MFSEPIFASTEEIQSRRYRGFNPKFVRQVWEKRKAESPPPAIAAATPPPPPEPVVIPLTSKCVLREAARKRRIEELERQRIAGREKLIRQSAHKDARAVIARVALEMDVRIEDLLGPRRSVKLVEARHKAMIAVALERPKLSLPQIGRLFNRDHTTIIHALQKHGVDRRSPTSSS